MNVGSNIPGLEEAQSKSVMTNDTDSNAEYAMILAARNQELQAQVAELEQQLRRANERAETYYNHLYPRTTTGHVNPPVIGPDTTGLPV